MIVKRFTKSRLVKAVFGCLFGIIGAFGGMMAPVEPVYAVPAEEVVDENVTETNDGSTESTKKVAESVSCDDTLGSLAWLACPGTGAISKATDFLYEKIESILVINPVEMKDGEPVYEIWKYAKGVANIIFIGFLLVVVYSQITGMGINNYGIKKILPKLIVAAVLVNLSFIICSLAVDVSNIIGGGVRGLFTSIGEATVGTSGVPESVRLSEIYASIGGGTLLTLGAVAIMWGTGTIWMLIATVIGAVVAVVIGLVTIAMRQAVVMLLIMISPLAVVAYMLPNTEKWFKMWKNLLMRMLVFYPLFSLLFGASALAGWAIIASAKEDGFMVILGVAVQTFPLFFSWSLMKMSGTVLGTINSKLTALASKPLAQNRAWAESRRDAARAKALASGRVYTPSLALRQYMSNRKIARDEETAEYNATIKKRGQAYAAKRNYDKRGVPTKEGRDAYERQARNMRYDETIMRHRNNMSKGLGQLEVVKAKATTAEKAKLDELDMLNVKASDALKVETARGAEIEYQNTQGFYERVINAQHAHDDDKRAGDRGHQKHTKIFDSTSYVDANDLARYNSMREIMEGNEEGVLTVLGEAASSYNAQAKIRNSKFQIGASLTPATQTVVDHLKDLINRPDKMRNIDAILGALSVLNMRGDTDLMARRMTRELTMKLGDSVVRDVNGSPKFCDESSLILGTYASQAVANFAMFEVKDNDPLLRRWGKYINMQTAALYDDRGLNEMGKRRVRKDVSWYEYINSEYVEQEEVENADGTITYRPKIDENGNVVKKKTRGMRELMQGTSYTGVERTAFQQQLEGVRAASYEIDSDGQPEGFSVKKFLENKKDLDMATMANIIGDHLSYRSQSEQIIAFSKYMTGIGKDGYWDWEYIFGKENIDNITMEDKKAYIEHSKEMMETFLGGQTPSHLQRTKSDLFESIKSQFALFDEVMHEEVDENGKRKERVDLGRLNALERDGGIGDRKTFAERHKDAITNRLLHAYKPKTLAGFAKALDKGFMPEAKAGYLDYMPSADKIREEYPDEFRRGGQNSNRERQGNNSEDEDGTLITSDDGIDLRPGSGIYNDARREVEELYRQYRNGGVGPDAVGYWSAVQAIVGDRNRMGGDSVSNQLYQLGLGVNESTNIDDLHQRIMGSIFGADS